MQIGRFNVKKWVDIRDSSRDGWIKEFMKQKLSSGLFWAVVAAEKKTPNCGQKKIKLLKKIS